jgi:hypothetical protein
LIEILGSVVDAWEHVAVQVDHVILFLMPERKTAGSGSRDSCGFKAGNESRIRFRS